MNRCMLGHFETLLNVSDYIVDSSLLNIQQESEEESLQAIMATKEKSAQKFYLQRIWSMDVNISLEWIACRYRFKKMTDVEYIYCGMFSLQFI